MGLENQEWIEMRIVWDDEFLPLKWCLNPFPCIPNIPTGEKPLFFMTKLVFESLPLH